MHFLSARFLLKITQAFFVFFIAEKSNAQNFVSKDKGFWQEYHELYNVGKTPEENNIRSIAVDSRKNIWVTTATGVFVKGNNVAEWSPLLIDGAAVGPAYCVVSDEHDRVWVGVWNGLLLIEKNKIKKVGGIDGPVSAICKAGKELVVIGPTGSWSGTVDNFTKRTWNIGRSVRSAIADRNGVIWIATEVGLFKAVGDKVTNISDTTHLLSASIKGAALDVASKKLWVAGLGGVSILHENGKSQFIRPAQGCPSIFTNCIEQAPDSAMWVGTKTGVVRFYKNGTHSLLFTKRWLGDDNVNDIAFDPDGNAWIATSNGVSAIKRKWMTLEDKQNYFYDVLMRRHIREPWIAGQCKLQSPGDTLHWQPEDDDNDGEYTGNYLAMESFRYAVTHSEDARAKAAKAFHFLWQLREITGDDGYFARTIVPAEWESRVHDGNRTYTPEQKAESLVNDPRYKPVETRWRKSADGRWLWKGDASSDEWCGHMMGYFFYYQLAATQEEKKLVSKQVATLVDHLIAHDFSMVDVDGTHTHWAVWSPNSLNRDHDWAPDKCQNSLELLTFLKLAYYVTSDKKYQQQYLHLIKDEHYLENAKGILNQNPAWFIYFDVTLQAYLFPILLQCEDDPVLLKTYQQLADKWMEKRRADNSPLINFLYCIARNKQTELKASTDFLLDTPLDLVDWDIDHTRREDVQIVHYPTLDEAQVNQLPPAGIRNTVRWDRNPWAAKGGYPEVEREPVFWLYPYWMGRYLGMIK